MIRTWVLAASILVTGLFNFEQTAKAITTEDRFQDLFLTAGYATAFGAALGAAALSFQDQPSKHLRFVAVGASLGFFGGSVLGTYVIFNPMFAEDSPNKGTDLLANHRSKGLRLIPQFDSKAKLVGIGSSLTLLEF
tara:strand:+ start:968 stop:1375 length:408 start_codon:yes stop_codon:yes gene_type:complete